MSGFPTRLVGLGAVHVAAGSMAGACVISGIAPTAAETFLDALLVADLALLGIWAGFGEHSKLAGFVGVTAGSIYFCVLKTLAAWNEIAGGTAGIDGYVMLWYWMYFLAMALLTLTVLVAAAVWLRRRGMHLRIPAAPRASGESDDLQFSLRQLLFLVFLVAVLVNAGPTVRAKFNSYLSPAAMLLAVSCASACFAAVGLGGLWSALSLRPSAAKFALAFSLAGGLSLLPPYYFPELLTNDFVRSAAVLLGATTIVIGSLLAVRQCGYRLAAGGA